MSVIDRVVLYFALLSSALTFGLVWHFLYEAPHQDKGITEVYMTKDGQQFTRRYCTLIVGDYTTEMWDCPEH
jgi:hypothetical protein